MPSLSSVAKLDRVESVLATIKGLAKQRLDQSIVREAQWLADRAASGELTVLIAGQFKRGKSTRINALFGEDILPTGVLPLTSAATTIHSGQRHRAVVGFHDGGSTEVDGVRMIDTPGIASTFTHNTESAHAALREADVAVLVVGPEPPIGGAELAFTKEVRDAAERLFVVINKVDMLPGRQAKLIDFTEQQLRKVLGFIPRAPYRRWQEAELEDLADRLEPK